MDRSTIIGFILIGIVLIAYTQYRGKIYKEKQAILQQEQLARMQDAIVDTVEVNKKKPAKDDILKEENPQVAPVIRYEDLKKYEKGPEKTITVETDMYRAVISTKGAVLKEWVLKKYLRNDNSEYELIKNTDGNNLSLGYVNADQDSVSLSKYYFEVDDLREISENKYFINMNAKNGERSVRLRLSMDDGREIVKTFVFSGQSYELDLNYSINGFRKEIANREVALYWGSGLGFSEKNRRDESSYMKAYAYMAGDNLEKIDSHPGKLPVNEVYTGDTFWTAVRSKYFVSAIMAVTGKGKGVHLYGSAVSRGIKSGKYEDKHYQTGLILDFPEKDHQEYKFKVYLGPIVYNNLKAYNARLEKMMDFGWSLIRPISKLMYVSLKWMYSFIPNYGIVIILFSLIIKVVLWPLTKGSYKSMGKMQEIQPKLKELQEKYKGDMQRIQKEQMKLYKEHGVNPMGFCLPTVLQMPVFFALYPVFKTLIDFRGAKFVWWIKDLSSPDTVFILPFSLPIYGANVNLLPIIWAASMFIQQKLTMKDPKQKMMTYFMPVFMLLIFNQLNSGLVLYWTVFNILSLLQQTLTGKKDKPATA